MIFVTFQFIYKRFEDWVRVEEGEGTTHPNQGQFVKELRALVAESNEWTPGLLKVCLTL
ncbi:hypothetical protein [Arthrobacter sp. CAN_C5]|uniref:hypothetical protein n=1 Tax=Arthrobacter sp. CAN_C5 TaxID=2760706 RepID=UPI001AE4CDCE|nr:hypothetical protein [Arthrobacter sp. CAN_C5]MBP2218020.1 hypothetical protein [Arthrobacter sp. CAN_C5]